jgi:hypothetical protein
MVFEFPLPSVDGPEITPLCSVDMMTGDPEHVAVPLASVADVLEAV